MDYTFKNMNEDIDNILDLIQQTGKPFDEVVGLARGGVIPATIISHRLEIPLKIVDWSLRDFKRQDHHGAMTIAFNIEKTKRRYLIVDDILDTGASIDKFFDSIHSAFNFDGHSPLEMPSLACLITNFTAESLYFPQYSGRIINRNIQKDWINFWWEKK